MKLQCPNCARFLSDFDISGAGACPSCGVRFSEEIAPVPPLPGADRAPTKPAGVRLTQGFWLMGSIGSVVLVPACFMSAGSTAIQGIWLSLIVALGIAMAGSFTNWMPGRFFLGLALAIGMFVVTGAVFFAGCALLLLSAK